MTPDSGDADVSGRTSVEVTIPPYFGYIRPIWVDSNTYTIEIARGWPARSV